MSGAQELFDEVDGGVIVRVHVQPGAGRTAVVGRHGDALKVRVAAPPQDGRANEAAAALIADILGVAASSVELVSGPASRAKRFRVKGVEADDASTLLRTALDASAAPGGGPGDRSGHRRWA
jgi:uncharacterized protein